MSVKTNQNPSNNITHSGTVTLPAYGNSGQYLTNTNYINVIGGTNSPSWSGTTTIQSSILSIRAQGNGDAIIETNHHKINLDEFYKLTTEMLCIIQEDKKLHEEYPTLKDAYDFYRDTRQKGIEIKIDNDVREAYNAYQALKAVITSGEK